VDAFEAALSALEEAGSIARLRLAFFDHVSSKPAVLFPVSEICRLFRARGVPTLVDGAHAPGLLHWAGEVRHVYPPSLYRPALSRCVLSYALTVHVVTSR
jgi:hypothetical protein